MGFPILKRYSERGAKDERTRHHRKTALSPKMSAIYGVQLAIKQSKNYSTQSKILCHPVPKDGSPANCSVSTIRLANPADGTVSSNVAFTLYKRFLILSHSSLAGP
jgi:hypothetical protein